MTTKKNQTTQTQIERANAVLIDLRPNVTALDRKLAMKELYLSEPTVNRYLMGDAKKIDIALMLIEFLQQRITDREQKLIETGA